MTYPVITLCGSLRMGKDLWDKVAHDLSLEGYLVITIHVWMWEDLHYGDMIKEKQMLDKMHKQRITMSDGIFVINLNGYIGPSTSSEIETARKLGKFVRYMEPLQESLPSRKPDDAHQVGASPENQDRVLKEIDQKEQGEKE